MSEQCPHRNSVCSRLQSPPWGGTAPPAVGQDPCCGRRRFPAAMVISVGFVSLTLHIHAGSAVVSSSLLCRLGVPGGGGVAPFPAQAAVIPLLRWCAVGGGGQLHSLYRQRGPLSAGQPEGAAVGLWARETAGGPKAGLPQLIMSFLFASFAVCTVSVTVREALHLSAVQSSYSGRGSEPQPTPRSHLHHRPLHPLASRHGPHRRCGQLCYHVESLPPAVHHRRVASGNAG